MKIYIAGKVTGEPIHEVTMKFGNAQKEIEQKGHEAVNPLAVVNDWHKPWDEAMKLCINALLDCDAILLLDDFMLSRGAMIERGLARELEFKVYFRTSDI